MSGSPDKDEPDAGEGFLSRWSRRKRAVEADTQPAPAPAAIEPAPVPDERPRDPETGEPIDAEWVASLPDIGSLKPGDDLSAFMRRGVPEALRRQALRTLWTTDPAIRDFVSPALDYAYDYNTPGGAPGYGVLSEQEIAAARGFVDRLFSAPPQAPQDAMALASGPESDIVPHHQRTGADADAGPQPDRDAAAQQQRALSGTALAQERRSAEAEGGAGGRACAVDVSTSPPDHHAATQHDPARSAPASPARRRGGRATPV